MESQSYFNKRNEENIYLNNGIDETGRVENSVDEKEEEAIENEEIKYIDIVSLGNLIIHQSQINGAKNENGYDFETTWNCSTGDVYNTANFDIGGRYKQNGAIGNIVAVRSSGPNGNMLWAY